jgi:zinc protease
MQQSAELVSMFQITATARPGHTTDELEAAIEAELAAFVKSGPTEAEMASSLTVFEDAAPDVDRAPGAAWRISSTSTTTTGAIRIPVAGSRPLPCRDAGDVRDFVATQLRRDTRTVVSVVPGPKVVPPAPATPPAPPKTTRLIESREPVAKADPRPRSRCGRRRFRWRSASRSTTGSPSISPNRTRCRW